MIDNRFYDDPTPISVDDIVKLIGAEKHRGSGSLMVCHVASAGKVDVGGLCFAISASAAEQVRDEKGVICLVTPEHVDDLGKHVCVIVSSKPKRDFNLVIKAIFEDATIEVDHYSKTKSIIHPNAVIEDDVEIGEGCTIEANAFIGKGSVFGAGCYIGASTYIGHGCVLGEGSAIEPNVKISYAIIGKSAQISSGVVIGSTGFGIGDYGDGNVAIPHLGRVIIGDYCHIGANTVIDRGFIDDTVIGSHVMLDSLVMIGHNAIVGDGNILCSQAGIAGSTTVGNNNIFGGQSGTSDHLTIGSNNIFTGRAGVTKSIGDNQTLSGFPAISAREFRREVATLRRLANSKKPSTKND